MTEWKRTSELELGDKVTRALPADELWSGFVLVADDTVKPSRPVRDAMEGQGELL